MAATCKSPYWRIFARRLLALPGTSIWLWSCLALLGAAAALADGQIGAEVVYVSDKSYAIINVGSLSGLKRGDQVCFHDDSGNKSGCGSVRAVRKRLSGVKVDASTLKQLRLGTEVRSANIKNPDAPPPSQAEIKRLADALDQEKGKTKPNKTARSKPAKNTKAPPSAGLAYRAGSGLEIGLVTAPLLPFRFNVPVYDLKNEIQGTGALWRTDTEVKSDPANIEVALVWTPAEPWALVLGGRVRAGGRYSFDDDYVRDDPEVFIRGKTSYDSRGGFLLARFSHELWQGLGLAPSLGLDVDRSTVAYQATRVDVASESEVVRYASTLLLISARVGMQLYYAVGTFALGLSADALVPLAGKPSFAAPQENLKSDLSQEQKDRAGSDLKNTIDHKKSSYGAQVGLSLGWHFFGP